MNKKQSNRASSQKIPKPFKAVVGEIDAEPAPRGRPMDTTLRQKIIDIAGQMFCSQGFDAVTMDELAAALGISKLTLYRRFETKESLFTAVIESKCQAYIPSDMFAELHHLSVEEALFQLAHGLMSLLTSDDVMGMEKMLMTHGEQSPDLKLLFYEAGPMRFKRMLADLFRSYDQRGLGTYPHPMLAAHAFGACIKGSDIVLRVTMNIGAKPTSQEIKRYCKFCVSLFL